MNDLLQRGEKNYNRQACATAEAKMPFDKYSLSAIRRARI